MKKTKTKIGRNAPCPCGSGKKHKKCCLLKPRIKRTENVKSVYMKRHKINLKGNTEIQGIKKAGKLVVDTLNLVEEFIKPGITTDDINTLVHEYTIKNNAKPAPLHYRGFPKSVCVSVNEVICHGIPGHRKLLEGDIVNVDVTSILNGYYADANKTFFVGTPGKDAKKIVSVSRESLKCGMDMVRPGNTVGDIGWAIQTYAEGERCSVVREFVGHGVGLDFHEPPQIPHYGIKRDGITLVPGMVFTIEPMVNLGKKDMRILADEWTAITIDNSLSAQFEQTVLVTESGCESLTPYDLNYPI